ncbi:Aminoglycoside phosphotransferase [Penicillium argentinense]|uniref:Aminoglycoside phosphotransferase n=1 Tax=Penicillium argentinense TaxID=1131581 RepID=A0A9W9F824_9EURO|nr:Aminoglycoside phosphotransferase [Penicillium argentinense]XP_056473453.1 Aminoglycoside phosphotransferase [Penicillium argentinense]KAJ5081959.1 Aminoglycoside phosphotransferase [Penicillium argentinense]KAJ5095303.1 Aminoglycoside phosphotransferase [Penicillium argentinense]
MIPKSPVFDAKSSRFFERFARLPSPDEVRKQAETQHLEGLCLDERKSFSIAGPHVRPPPVVFKDLGLFVKWGTAMSISEGQCLWAIGQRLKDHVPVPEIYGWREDGNEVFIYMEYLHAQTLEQAWDVMEPAERVSVCSELRTIFDNLRQLEQGPEDRFIGNIVRSSLYDRAIHVESMSEAGPFNSVQEFHDWFTFLHRRPMPNPYSVPIEPFRHDLPDDCPIKFTHGDLHRSNILITQSRPYHIVAIIDWEQSGWLPAYWEARKAQFTADRNEDWSKVYLPMILCQFMSTWDPWDYYTTAMGC